MIRYLLLLYIFILAGCGGGGGGGASQSQSPAPLATGSFWAVDFTGNSFYVVNASEVGQGNFCHVYLESGQSVSQTAINDIIAQFDNAIHPNDNIAFGGEPNPGIDSDPKIYILLLNLRDGFTPGVSTSLIAGYFDPTNEYALSTQNPHSNQKEILFLNINPAAQINPDGVAFFATIAHEFQHMIHWEQKTHLRRLNDDTWIDEAMAQVSRTFCGYGPDYTGVFAYEHDIAQGVNHSLINFDETVGNYGMVYMWAQYFKDRIGTGIFYTMLHNNMTGMNSVNAALSSNSYPKDFAGTFSDWALANFFGDGSSVAVHPGNPAWTYTSINTWPGDYAFNGGQSNVTLPGLFPFSRQNLPTLQALDQWSIGYYSYTPVTANPSVTWFQGTATTTAASFINGNTTLSSVTNPMISGTLYEFTNIGYLIYMNPSSTSYLSPGTPVDTVAHAAKTPSVAFSSSITSSSATSAVPAPVKTPREMLAEIDVDPTVRRLVQETGKPHRVYVDSWFREREKTLRALGFRPPF